MAIVIEFSNPWRIECFQYASLSAYCIQCSVCSILRPCSTAANEQKTLFPFILFQKSKLKLVTQRSFWGFSSVLFGFLEGALLLCALPHYGTFVVRRLVCSCVHEHSYSVADTCLILFSSFSHPHPTQIRLTSKHIDPSICCKGCIAKASTAKDRRFRHQKVDEDETHKRDLGLYKGASNYYLFSKF